MRGEHTAGGFFATNPWGSSPHARGALVSNIDEIPAKGIIPACAGSTDSH